MAMDATLETDRLLLRPMQASDAPAIAAKINNFEISKNLARVPYPYNLADAEAFLSWAEGLDERSQFRIIALKQVPKNLIGIISFDFVEDTQSAELGYWMVKEQWGKGLMTEAAKAMVQLAFESAGLSTLSSCYFVENPASGNVLEKAGFEAAGACTHFSRSRNADIPVINMRLSRSTWIKKKAAV
jgi:[ribosomal protein S5]-alanine N-acetyltransferase